MFDSLAHAKNGQHSWATLTHIIVLKCIKRYFTREFDISISLGGASGRPTGPAFDIGERARGVHVRISAQLGLDRSRMSAMTANASKNCVNLYGLTLEI